MGRTQPYSDSPSKGQKAVQKICGKRSWHSEKGFFYALKERRYFALKPFNEEVWENLDELNDALLKKKEHCRSYYWAEEKEELMPLPST
ncbi:hypothetical protein [Anaerostipes butyraticus]|uniref:hypothetical protein n=1 Tax=Anaerostipes butyraticus TaxID=645466 RepID=UPI00320B8DA3